MNPWPLNPAAIEAVEPGHGAEDRLPVGRDVVDALASTVKSTYSSTAAARGSPRGLAPPRGAPFRRAGGAEVAREHASVGELLRGEAPLGRDDERLEQALANRLGEEEQRVSASIGSSTPSGLTRSHVAAPAARTTAGALSVPLLVSTIQPPAVCLTPVTAAIRTSRWRAIARIAAWGSSKYPSSAHHAAPTSDEVSSPGTRAAASDGSTMRDGTPASFWTRTLAVSRASTPWWCASKR